MINKTFVFSNQHSVLCLIVYEGNQENIEFYEVYLLIIKNKYRHTGPKNIQIYRLYSYIDVTKVGNRRIGGSNC